MEEIRRNNTVKIEFGENCIVEGFVLDYISDRIMISVNTDSLETAKQLKELDKIRMTIYTPLGIKIMETSVISPINPNSCIVIENVPTAQIAQRRAFVRIPHDFGFDITTQSGSKVNCKCVNISAGGIAFTTNQKPLQAGDEITIYFPSELFERDIICNARIITAKENFRFAAKYENLKSYDEDKIVKFVFKRMTRIVN